VKEITDLPPPRSGGVVTVAEIERKLRRREVTLFPSSDDDGFAATPTPAERVLTLGAHRWDFRETETVNVLLEEELHRVGLSEQTVLLTDLTTMLRRFAVTETCRELATGAAVLARRGV